MSTVRSLKERLDDAGYILNGYIQMSGAFSAELYSRQGWDSVTIDLEHGPFGIDGAIEILRAITASGVFPMVRIPSLDSMVIGTLLDAGVLGVTCAMINTAEDAERLVRYCRYPPRGERGMGRMTRAVLVHGSGYIAAADRLINVFAMIESVEGVANVDAIAAVEGIDGIYVGPTDLAMSMMGRAPQIGVPDPKIDAEVDMAVERVLQRCQARGLIAGIMAPTPEAALRMIDRGFRFITLASDIRALTVQTKTWVEGCRRLVGNRNRPAGKSQ